MKKYIYLICLVSSFAACGEEELVWYGEEKDAIQFYVDDESETAAGALNRKYNFAEATYEEKKGDVTTTYYYGDNKKEVSFEKVLLQLQGFPTPDERPYKLKSVLLEGDPETQPEVIFEPYYSLYPNCLLDTVQFVVTRPKARGTYKIAIQLDTEEEEAFFTVGAVEQSSLELTIMDVYYEPENWKDRLEWLGTFSQEKYALMVTYSQQPFNRFDPLMWNDTEEYVREVANSPLVQAYNEAHPDAPVTFPMTTKRTWWDQKLYLLGEFSEEKHEFMCKIVGDKLPQNNKLEYWNLIFRDEIEKQGITAFEVPVNERQSSWWRSQPLGEWTLAKQEFVLRTLFERGGKDFNEITEDVWVYGNVLVRSALDEYNQQHPDAVLNLDFPIEGEPAWWNMHVNQLGDYHAVVRDLLVLSILNGYGSFASLNYSPLVDNLLEELKRRLQEYNDAHPDDTPIQLPVNPPAWWDRNLNGQENHFGEFSGEKENFIKSILSHYKGQYNGWFDFSNWNAIFRYELAAHNATAEVPYTFEFPFYPYKPTFWDNYASIWGDYSETKQVFIWMLLLPESWGIVDDWYVSTYSGKVRSMLIECYHNGTYEAFMQYYAVAGAEPFEFPE